MLADLLKGIVQADDQIEIVAELTDVRPHRGQRASQRRPRHRQPPRR
jgi:hypothetical protein